MYIWDMDVTVNTSNLFNYAQPVTRSNSSSKYIYILFDTLWLQNGEVEITIIILVLHHFNEHQKNVLCILMIGIEENEKRQCSFQFPFSLKDFYVYV